MIFKRSAHLFCFFPNNCNAAEMGLRNIEEKENRDIHIKMAVVNRAYNKRRGNPCDMSVRFSILLNNSLVAKVWNIYTNNVAPPYFDKKLFPNGMMRMKQILIKDEIKSATILTAPSLIPSKGILK